MESAADFDCGRHSFLDLVLGLIGSRQTTSVGRYFVVSASHVAAGGWGGLGVDPDISP
jgi:hypothetical protein